MGNPNRELRRARDRARRKLEMGPGTDAFERIPASRWPAGLRTPAGLADIHQNSRFLVFECRARPPALALTWLRNGSPWSNCCLGSSQTSTIGTFGTLQ